MVVVGGGGMNVQLVVENAFVAFCKDERLLRVQGQGWGTNVLLVVTLSGKYHKFGWVEKLDLPRFNLRLLTKTPVTHTR